MNLANVSVIIPTYNSLTLLQRTLASFERQLPDPGGFEIVVVDDGSTDGTAEWLRKYSGCLNLVSVLQKQNSGRAFTRNVAASKATGSLLLMIDGDMEFGEYLVSGHAENHHGEENLVVMGRVIYDRTLGCRGYARYIETRGAAKLPHGEALPGRYFISSHVSLPRDLLLEVGGFNTDFKAYGGEDLDLGMRLVGNGARLIQNPDLISEHLHIRNLKDVVRTTFEYGKYNVPVLVKEHPELFDQLKLDWPIKSGVVGFIRKLILSAICYQILFTVLRLLNWIGAPARLYDYLIFRNYYRGYKSSGRQLISEGLNGNNS